MDFLYSLIGGLSFDYVYDTGDFEYTIEDISTFNGEIIYVVSFVPDRGLFAGNGDYTGTHYISANSFAIVKADYQLAEGENGKGFGSKWLVGTRVETRDNSGTVIFQKNSNGKYVPKYIRSSGTRYMYFDRNLKLKENDENRKDRVKIKLEMSMEMENHFANEWLFVDTLPISETEFSKFKQNKGVVVEELSEYNPGIWKEYTTLAPTESIREYEY